MNSSIICSANRKAEGRLATSLSLLIGVLIVLVPFLNSCGSSLNENYKEESAQIADSVGQYIKGIATDSINGISHNFIRKADVKCRVKDVIKSTQAIEHLTGSLGGYVTSSKLNTTLSGANSIQVQKDSVLEQETHTTECLITMRVPYYAMDTLMDEILLMAEFTDSRNISCDDVKMKLFANKLAENRYREYKETLKKRIRSSHEKINRVEEAQDQLLEKQTIADETRIQSYDLADQVNYSTISIHIYQDPVHVNKLTVLPASPEPYVPGFGEKLKGAFLNGFELLKNLILFGVNCWSLLLISIILFIAVKKGITFLSKRSAA